MGFYDILNPEFNVGESFMERDELIELFAGYMASEVGVDAEDRKGKLVGYMKPYLFTNERLDVVIRRLKPMGKKVLATGSSGDQAIYSVANGAKEVTVFDLCPFTKMITEYKIACFKNLSYEKMRALYLINHEMFSAKAYAKISHDLPGDVREFWDTAFLNGFDYSIMPISTRKDSPIEFSTYLKNEDEYNKIKNALAGEYKIDNITTHLKDLPEILPEGEKYDIILLSNIINFVDKWEDSVLEARKSYWRVVNKLANKLNPGGVIQIDYGYLNLLKKYKYYAELLGRDKVTTSGTSYSTGAILYHPNIDESEQ